MHSRIIELKYNNDEPNCLDNLEIPEWFNSYADYWTTISGDLSASIDWFFQYLEDRDIKVVRKENKIILNRESALTFFKQNYENWKNTLEELVKCSSLKAFANYDMLNAPVDENNMSEDFKNACKLNSLYSNLQYSYEDECGFWVYVNGDLKTLDNFMRDLRYCLGKEEEVELFIGNIVDYHF